MRHDSLLTDISRINVQVILLICLVLTVSACATYPTQELSDARQAIEAAKAIEANKHIPSIYQKAADMLTKAEENLQASPPHYADAKTHALSAKEEAVKARLLTSAILEARQTISKFQTADNELPEANKALDNSLAAIEDNNVDEALKNAELAKNLAIQGR